MDKSLITDIMTQRTYRDLGIEIPYGRQTGKVKVFCPHCHTQRHDKRDKSLSIDLDKGLGHCHYCGWGFSLSQSDYDDSPEGKQRWMEQQPWYRPEKIRHEKPQYKRPQPHPTAPVSDKALAWFRGRGISQETLTACKVTEGEEWMPQDGKPMNTVQFNYYLNGELVNTKFRTGSKHFKMCSGARLIPYLIDNIKGEKECIITEGEIDALSLYEVGFKNVISVPNGANANLEYLDDFIEEYFEDKDVIFIASDSDTKGVELRDELLHRFGAERCRVVAYGEGCKDANEHLMKYGAESLRQAVESAPETPIDGVYTVSDFEDSLDAIFENGLQRGVLIGHSNIDSLISFETKRLLTVTGIPGSGKSEFIDEIAERLNMRYGWRFAYFSPENAPLAYHASKLIEKFTGKKFSRQTLTQGEYRQVKRHLESDFFFISPKDDYRLDTILSKAKSLVRRKGVKAVVIDPYNRLEDEWDGRLRETQVISRQLDKLTNFAQRNDVLVILMAHPTKQAKTKDGKIEPPTLYDISGSAHFYNKTDFGLVVHRDREAGTVLVNVAKVKFRHLGQVGTAVFKYNMNNGRYVPYYEGVEPRWDNDNHLTEIVKREAQESETQIDWNNPSMESDLPF